MNKLIVAEKPSVAVRIATALGDSRPRTESINGVRYFIASKDQDQIFIVSAVGHLFTLSQVGPNKVPIFDIQWVPSYKVSTGAYFTKKYLDAIEIVGKQCTFFINACDYDIEGTVIGTNILKQIVNKNVNSELGEGNFRRMRFSTTTDADLRESYANMNAFDSLNFDAGEARHKLDWMWGINMSRALMAAIATKGIRKTLSAGRVQGPALGILAKREMEIKNFVSKPYWKIIITSKGSNFEAKDKEIFEKKVAEAQFNKAKASAIKVKSVDSDERSIRPFPPFDLTSLQIEASRVFHIDPSKTLAIAQSLYERSYISYPRTSSQKLPPTLNLPRVITAMSKIPEYAEMASKLIKESRFRPAEGAKDDEAHPAVYPTGEEPKKMSDEESKIYDLIARRFLACFGYYAKSAVKRVAIDVGGEEYRASGEKITLMGWMELYKYYTLRESQISDFTVGEAITPEKVDMKSLKTLPPKRYTKASIISVLEGKELGTKATRAEIIDTLFRRDYIKGSNIEVTEFGLSIYNALSAYCSEILDEDLTRKLELDMEKIQKGQATKSEVINEGKEIITSLIGKFKLKESQIGDELIKGLKESENSSLIGPCSKCGTGSLILRRSAAGKNFIGCTDYPKCTNTYSVPQNAKIVATGKICELCHTPKIKVFRRGKRPFDMDLDPNCETKKDWAKAPAVQTGAQAAASMAKPGLNAGAAKGAAPSAAPGTAPAAASEVQAVRAKPSAVSEIKSQKVAKTKRIGSSRKPKRKPAPKRTKDAANAVE
ncbi:MAG: DNA topoisomerase I [Candidatus Micrarchaeaceae archaeon]